MNEGEWAEHFAKIDKVRKKIIEHAQGKKNMQGEIPCPACTTGTVHYSIAFNGHVHARCSTEDCVSWME